MGGKSATTTQQVQIPPEVMARYRAVNTRAEQTASQPFQAYSQDPSAFVAPLTQTQQAGIQNINRAAGMTQPYFETAAGLTLGGAQGVGPLTQQQIGYYQNPFTQSVVGSTLAGLQQQQGQQLAQQQAEAIKAGAFGGDRAGIQRAQLQGQQNLATAQAISPLYQRGYEQAVQTAAGQQAVVGQDLQRQLAAGQQLGGLGAAGQQAALAGAQAQLGAGTAEQQTQQAGLQALYNQFLQQRGYDFQTAQFLANIAMGTGALSGSTTTTQQPVPFFSDEREKTNVQSLGKGLYAYDYKDDVRRAEEEGRPMPPKRVGPMAQDIEERAPGLVGEVGGHKVVKGLNPESMGGAVLDLGPDQYRERFAPGGLVGADDLRAILAAQQQAFGPFAQSGLYGGNPQQGGAGKPGYVPGTALPTPKLMTAGAAPRLPESTVSQGLGTAREFGITPSKMYEYGQAGLGKAREMTRQGPSRAEPPAPSSQGAMAASAAMPSVEYNEEDRLRPGQAYGGLVGYAGGGSVDKDDPMASYGAQRADIGIPTEAPDIKPLEGAKPPSTQPQSVAGDVAKLATAAAALFALSDARMKDNIEPVGELYDGQPVYRYNMKGSPKTQLGLMAQDLEHNGHGDAVAGLGGVKMVDYKRATDVAAGLAPRQGYQAGGTPSFDEALRRTLSYEGGYAEDAGGPTMMGISSRANPDVNLQRVKEDPEYRSSIYRERYWNPIGADRMDPRMANVAFDTAVNLGVGRTRQLLEEAGNDPARLLQLRQQHYNDLIARDPETYGRYGRGWSNRVNDLMAYAGGQGQAPASAEINRVAGAPQGLGQARPSTSEPAAPTSQERSALAGFLPVKFGTRTLANPKGEEFGGVGEFLTSRQFVQPLLEGIGAMASSQSLSGVGAALQGLGAASRAYTGLEKEMAGTAQTAEQTRLTQAEADISRVAAQGATIKNFEGRLVILVRGPDGKPTWVDFQDRAKYDPYILAAGEQAPLPPSKTAEPGQIRQGDLSTRKEPAAKTEGPEAAAAGAAEAPKTPAPFRGTNPLTFDQSLEERARQEARTMERETNVTLSSRKDMVEETNRAAAAASAEKKIMLELGVLASTPGGFLSQGALLPYKMRLARVANDIVGREVFDEKDLARFEAWEKKLTELSASAARSGDQTAVEALSRLRTMYPSPEQSQPGAAKNAAEVLIRNQQRIDEARLLNQYHDVIRGQTSRLSSRFDPSVRDLIDKKYENIYVKDRQALERMLDSSTGPSDPRTGRRMTDAQGKPMSWFTFLQKNGSRVDDEFVKQIEQRFNAPGIMRYFQTGG